MKLCALKFREEVSTEKMIFSLLSPSLKEFARKLQYWASKDF